MTSVDLSLTVFNPGDVVLEVLVMMAVLDVLVVTVSSCFTNMTTTPMRVPNATNTNDATPIIKNFPHCTDQPARASLSSPP
jgi:hypothetical protein